MSDHVNALGQPIGAPLPAHMTFPRPRPPRTDMQGRYVTLAPADPDQHASALYAAFREDHEDRIWTYLPYGPFHDPAAFHDWMAATCPGDDPLFHTILTPKRRAVGLASYLRIEPGHGAIEVGHINLAPALQRTAAATEAMYLMMRRVFDELGYRRYEWKCDALNAGSCRAAERLGFRYEGTFRQATHYKGRNRDTAWYAITDADWPGLRARLEDWLAPENFDSNGIQRSRLSA